MKEHMPVLIVAQPGRVRDGLQALLMAAPRIERVGLVNDVSSALGMTTERAPSLVLLDASLNGGGILIALSRIKSRWPDTRCLVLTESAQQQRVARSADADEVLLKGFEANELYAIVERLVFEPG
jgi:DNA-binding NarL/FixJ family response regulator